MKQNALKHLTDLSDMKLYAALVAPGHLIRVLIEQDSNDYYLNADDCAECLGYEDRASMESDPDHKQGLEYLQEHIQSLEVLPGASELFEDYNGICIENYIR